MHFAFCKFPSFWYVLQNFAFSHVFANPYLLHGFCIIRNISLIPAPLGAARDPPTRHGNAFLLRGVSHIPMNFGWLGKLAQNHHPFYAKLSGYFCSFCKFMVFKYMYRASGRQGERLIMRAGGGALSMSCLLAFQLPTESHHVQSVLDDQLNSLDYLIWHGAPWQFAVSTVFQQILYIHFYWFSGCRTTLQ